MYLVFKLHKKGFPVNHIYDSEVKNISTRRFNSEMMQKGEPGLESPKDMRGDSYIEFDSQLSYEDLGIIKVDPKPKPNFVPGLNFEGKLAEYVSSDEEELNDV